MITDRSFMSQIYDIIDPEYFDSEALRFLVKNTRFYFHEYRSLPTVDVFKVQIDSISSDAVKAEVKKTFTDAWTAINSPDLGFVKSTILDFCKNQELRKAILLSADLLQEGKYDEIKRVIDRAIKSGLQENIGIDYLRDIDYRYTEEDEQPRIPTGWPVLDRLLGGGLPRGKLGIISMPSGTGKSYFLCHLAAMALKHGFNVFYYTLELDDKYVAHRIDAALTGLSLGQLKNNIDYIKKRLGRFDAGRLIIKEYPTRRASWTTVTAHLEKMELLGIKADLVIVDDPELLKMPELRDQRKDEQIQELYEEIRGTGKEKGFAAWVPSQSNRSALDKKGPAGAESISASYAKIFTADIAIFGNRRGRHKITNTGEFKIEKNRLGPDGMILPCKFDTSTCQIEIYEERVGDTDSEIDGKEYLRKKYMEMVNQV